MTTNKILGQIDPLEASKSFVFPVELTDEQKKLAAEQLKVARQKSQDQATQKERLTARLMQLKFQLEDYITNKEFEQDRRFGNFLKIYLQILNKRRNEFANEIDVHETHISQLINSRRTPSDNIIIRLELHSNQSIPADYWFRLVQKEKIHEIKTNKQLRIQERIHVSKKISVRI